MRVRTGVHPEINGHFICDRGRFSFSYTNFPGRPRLPLVNRNPVSWNEALTGLCNRIDETITQFGPESVAFLGSNRAALESNALLRFWGERLGVRNILFEAHPQRDRAARVVAARLGKRARSLKDVRSSDLVVLVGADPLTEAPMSALAIRQAVLNGAYVAVIDSRPVALPFEAEHLTVRPECLGAVLRGLADGDFSTLESTDRQVLEGLWQRLERARNPVLMGGVDFLAGEGVELLLTAAEGLSGEGGRPCGAMVFLHGPNSYGGALLSEESPTFDEVINQALEGRLKVLVCLENDFLNNYPDPGLAQAARTHLSLLAVIDYLPSASAVSADIFLPSATPPEQEGVFVNNEGRMQAFRKVFEPGVPLRETGNGGFPPRVFDFPQALDQPREARRILASILAIDHSCPAVRSRLEGLEKCFQGLSKLVAESEGQLVSGPLKKLPQKKVVFDQPLPENCLALISMSAIFSGQAFLRPFPKPWSRCVQNLIFFFIRKRPRSGMFPLMKRCGWLPDTEVFKSKSGLLLT